MRAYILVITASMLCAALAIPASSTEPVLESPADVVVPVTGDRGVEDTFWYQGFLANVDTGEPINATLTVSVTMYDAPTGGSIIWGTETHHSVPIVEGWFNLELGSIDPLPDFDDPPYYLSLTVNGETMDERQKLASVPMASEAGDFSAPVSSTFNDLATGVWLNSTNASNINSGVYSQHSGIGAALRGYHTGSGPAIKADAMGTGLAGEFYGDVSVAGELLTTSFQMITGASNNYVLASDASGNGAWTSLTFLGDSDWSVDGDDMTSMPTGNVGIGATSPDFKLHVVGDIAAGYDEGMFIGGDFSLWAGSAEFRHRWSSIGGYDELIIDSPGDVFLEASDDIILRDGSQSEWAVFDNTTGYVGLGTTTPSSYLECVAASEPVSGRFYRLLSSVALSSSSDMLEIYAEPGSDANSQLIEAQHGSDIKFRVNMNGEVTADGSFTGGGADFAEMIRASGGAAAVEAGDVLVIDAANPRSIVKSSRASSSLVAGIYSTKPGFVGSTREWDVEAGNVETESLTRADMAAQHDEIPMAVVGIVPCKVSAENGSIVIGDLLVTSSTPGHAMRAETPRAGTILGKALEALPSGTGTISVLVTLQ